LQGRYHLAEMSRQLVSLFVDSVDETRERELWAYGIALLVIFALSRGANFSINRVVGWAALLLSLIRRLCLCNRRLCLHIK